MRDDPPLSRNLHIRLKRLFNILEEQFGSSEVSGKCLGRFCHWNWLYWWGDVINVTAAVVSEKSWKYWIISGRMSAHSTMSDDTRKKAKKREWQQRYCQKKRRWLHRASGRKVLRTNILVRLSQTNNIKTTFKYYMQANERFGLRALINNQYIWLASICTLKNKLKAAVEVSISSVRTCVSNTLETNMRIQHNPKA